MAVTTNQQTPPTTVNRWAKLSRILLITIICYVVTDAIEEERMEKAEHVHKSMEHVIQQSNPIAKAMLAMEEQETNTTLTGHSGWELEPKNFTSLYLYHFEEAAPVIDFDGKHWPDWLYTYEAGPRIVEFYAPWCPFCNAFRDHYIQFAKVVNDIAKEMGVQPINFYAVSCAANRPICKNWRIKGFPQIRLFRDKSRVPIVAEYYELHPFAIFDILGIPIDMNLGSVKEMDQKLRLAHKEKGDISFPPRSKRELFDDAYLSFDFLIRHSVYNTEGALDEERGLVLHIFLELLGGFVPQAWRLARYIRAILDEYEQAISSEEKLLEIADRYPPQQTEWSYSCTKGKPGMGFSCGLWQLFHIYSVGMVEWNKMLHGGQTEFVVSTVTAADFLRDFIEGFLDCEVCRQNFLKAYGECAANRCNRLTEEASFQQFKQLPLWLWETHNSVNQRLLKEHSARDGWEPTDGDRLKRRWPARRDCPLCWKDDGTWDEEMVYKFLRIEYWPEDSLTEEWRIDIVGDVDVSQFDREDEEEEERIRSVRSREAQGSADDSATAHVEEIDRRAPSEADKERVLNEAPEKEATKREIQNELTHHQRTETDESSTAARNDNNVLQPGKHEENNIHKTATKETEKFHLGHEEHKEKASGSHHKGSADETHSEALKQHHVNQHQHMGHNENKGEAPKHETQHHINQHQHQHQHVEAKEALKIAKHHLGRKEVEDEAQRRDMHHELKHHQHTKTKEDLRSENNELGPQHATETGGSLSANGKEDYSGEGVKRQEKTVRGNETMDDDDDDETAEDDDTVLQLQILASLFTAVAAITKIYQTYKQRKLFKSGRHKKEDGSDV